MVPVDRIIIHCAATPPDMDIGVAEITDWHIKRGFRTVGYHRVIRRNGVIELGRPWDYDGQVELEEVGAHALGYNKNSFGICLVGGVDDDLSPQFNFTRPQMSNLAMEINRQRILTPDIIVMGHNEVSEKPCPCFNVHQWWYGGK
jgi:hypothetical protein